MKITTIDSPRLTRLVHLQNAATLDAVVVHGDQWGVALHLATLGGWQMAGTLVQEHPAYRFGYSVPGGQRIEAADAVNIGSGLSAALDRYAAATESEKSSALLWLALHPARALGDETPWLALPSWRKGQAVAPFRELDELLHYERGTPGDSITLRGLRKLAAILSVPADWRLLSALPEQWISPLEEVLMVRVLPRRHDQSAGVNFEGKARAPGEEFLCRRQIAESFIAAGVLCLASDPIPTPPVEVAPTFRERIHSFVGV